LIDPNTGEKQYLSPKKTTKNERSRVKVEAPEEYRWIDSSGKAHKSKYMKDENGKDIYATVGGKVKQDKTGNYYYDKGSGKDAKDIWVNTGKVVPITQKVSRMSDAKNAYELLSDNPNAIEKTYADYANHMKTMGNNARKEYMRLQTDKTEKAKQKIDPVARKEYAKEVGSLKEKLEEVQKNKPRERQAQLLANSRINAALSEDPERYSSAEERKKLNGIMIKQASIDCGAQKKRVTFTDSEWEAIQKHAIGETALLKLLENADSAEYASRALPRESKITPAKKSMIQAYYNAGYTYEQIAAMTGVSQGTIGGIVN
jgi:DNA repair exonuclease SbcCD ATPase subunit